MTLANPPTHALQPKNRDAHIADLRRGARKRYLFLDREFGGDSGADSRSPVIVRSILEMEFSMFPSLDVCLDESSESFSTFVRTSLTSR